MGIIHTDLKPENILLKTDGKFHKIRDKTSSKKYYLPRNTDIKLIDFGNAVFEDEEDILHTSTINTRQFRAPEVTLKCGEWTSKSDVWGVGCIILELITGKLFFATHETYEHLAMIERVNGPMPGAIVRCSRNKEVEKYYDLSEQKFEVTFLQFLTKLGNLQN